MQEKIDNMRNSLDISISSFIHLVRMGKGLGDGSSQSGLMDGELWVSKLNEKKN